MASPHLFGGHVPAGLPTRLTLTVPAPPGALGLQFVHGVDAQHHRYVMVSHVEPFSPVYGKIVVGDKIVAVNGVNAIDQEVAFVQGILAGCQSTTRQISIYRDQQPVGVPPVSTQLQSAMIPASRSGFQQRVAFRPVLTQTDQSRSVSSVPRSNRVVDRSAVAATSSTRVVLNRNRNKENAAPATVNQKSKKPGLKKPPPPSTASISVEAPTVSRKAFIVGLPEGEIGLTFAAGTVETSHFIQVTHVDPKSSLSGTVIKGDWISHINGKSTQSIKEQEAMRLFEKQTAKRRMVVLREPSSNAPKPPRAATAKSKPSSKQAPKPKVTITATAAKQRLGVDSGAEPTKRQLATEAFPEQKRLKKAKTKPGFNDDGTRELPEAEDWPERGCVCEHGIFYCTKTRESLGQVAEKLGASWRDMAENVSHKTWYGNLKSASVFKADTLLCVPDKHSKWKIKQLRKEEFPDMMPETCLDCGLASKPEELLLCDGCDGMYHLKCVCLDDIPSGDWFCSTCVEILKARKEHGDLTLKEFTLSNAPSLDAVLSPEEQDRIHGLRATLDDYLHSRRRQDLQHIADTSDMVKWTLQQLIPEIKEEIARLEAEIKQAKSAALAKYGLQGSSWALSSGRDSDFIQFRENGRVIRLQRGDNRLNGSASTYTPEWNAARQRVIQYWNFVKSRPYKQKNESLNKNLKDAKENLENTKTEHEQVDGLKEKQQKEARLMYSALLNEPRLSDETDSEFRSREWPPRLLGQVQIHNDEDVILLSLLREPDELILLVPLTATKTSDLQDFEPQVGKTFAVFACESLFLKERDDDLPMDKNNVRDAQRRLFQLLVSGGERENQHIVVSSPSIPPTVRPRDTDASHSKCFDLTELVRDCNLSLDLPLEPTPESMVNNGLKLHPYQEQSLRWLLDKEQEISSLGLAGEFWHRLRFLDPIAPPQSDHMYFYCELTGSFALDIFDFKTDVDQSDASANRFGCPTGGCLGSEMGLGKTVIAIALILKNRPPPHRTVLPREHLWSLKKNRVIDHDDYVPLPRFGATEAAAKTNKVSNGTLVIVPQTLLAQWQTEIERFAPHLSIMVLHSCENPTLAGVASADVVIASTYIFQQHRNARKTAGFLLSCIKKVHWHRIVADEAHNNQEDHSITRFVGILSATHRLSLTGTPIGSKVTDLQGQLRLLRLAPFCRPKFFKQAISDPYHEERSLGSLAVLRSLLSHIVCRHSKQQTHENGKALVALPPRTISTVLLQFGSEDEQQLYDILETNNRTLLRKLKHESKATLQHNFAELNALLLAARQACCHVSLVNLPKIDHHLRRLQDQTGKGGFAVARTKSNANAEESQTRAGLLKLAAAGARPTARQRMIDVVSQFQTSGALIECCICLDATAETNIAIPPCAHPICDECILSIMSAASATREASGHCPTCRDTIRRSEITFLGDAEDAGTFTTKPQLQTEMDTSKDEVLETNLPSFALTASVTHASVTGASTNRVDCAVLTEAETVRKTQERQAELSCLEELLVSSCVRAEPKVGSKIACLLREVDAMMKKSAESKCVVFSQFIPVLDVAEMELEARKIGVLRIDATRSTAERADALLEFSNNANIKVLLLSMRAGATGLTLTSADHCFILDVTQSPSLEEQAIDRIHRIGQTRPVTVKRFVMKGTVEERLLSVRRALLADKPLASTGVCATISLDEDEEIQGKKKAKEGDAAKTATTKRIETLEKIIGTLELQRA
ncbi:regulator of chromatin subfamily A member 3-like 1 [Seminavis robusta]|uniref:Regulator of chromatin subfamily A member 3-like 1 n=1 Tax=Seminavis robusta TaxID=568900 RepID=A0A9N8E175_9STRA|nr:regulator of chromatin subfamily A member 3-like 1 [Seminavis robusta]|eukprot:Sro545_g163920.1 regulator of chromatin subfamily A member 3-like 1 (1724) ;mRNA; r:47660-53606